MKARLNLLVIIIGLALTACQVSTSSESGQQPLPTPKDKGSMGVCPMDAKLCSQWSYFCRAHRAKL